MRVSGGQGNRLATFPNLIMRLPRCRVYCESGVERRLLMNKLILFRDMKSEALSMTRPCSEVATYTNRCIFRLHNIPLLCGCAIRPQLLLT